MISAALARHPGPASVATAALAALALAGCGVSAKVGFERHLRKDGKLLYHCCVNLTAAKRLHAAHRRVHEASLDLATASPPADARADYSALLAGFRFADTMLARLAHDADRQDTAALLRDGDAFKRGAVFPAFNRAIADLQRKGYDVGLLGR